MKNTDSKRTSLESIKTLENEFNILKKAAAEAAKETERSIVKITAEAIRAAAEAQSRFNNFSLNTKKPESAVEKAVIFISDRALEKARAQAGSYKEMGALYLNEMKRGIEDRTEEAVTAMSWAVDKQIAAFAETNKKASSSYRQAAKELMAVYKDELKRGGEEAYLLMEERVGRISSAAQEQYDTLIKAQERMKNTLSGYGERFYYDETGGFHLSSLKEQTKRLEKYGETLSKLQEMGAAQGLLNEIVAMDIEDGEVFAQKLLRKGTTAIQDYSEEWEAKQRSIEEITDRFFAAEAESINTRFEEEMNSAVVKFPELCQEIGLNAVEGIVKGMESGRADAVATAGDIADAIIKELKRATETASPSKRAAREVGAPLTQGVFKGMREAYDPREMAVYADRMMADIGKAQTRAAQGVLQRNTANTWNSQVYNGGDMILKIEKMVNDGRGSVSSLLREAEFYRRQRSAATGGA